MFALLDCIQYECPLMWQGTFQVKDDKNSILLEAIVVQSLWIWHAIFGLYRRNTDINVLDRSPLVTNFLKGDGQVMSFVVNDHMYPYYFLLIDCIFIPNGLYLYKQFIFPEEKNKNAKMHELSNKNVEYWFGVLQSKWESFKIQVTNGT